MPALAPELRRQLESVCVQARDLAEDAARSALKRWGVDAAKPFDHFSVADKLFRRRLRARGQQAGDRRDAQKDTQEIDQLTEDLAYEYWHRMLFARFLAENNLLMHPDGVAVTLAECEELARSEKAPNGFVLAARYASRMLPEIFRIDDVLLDVEFPINDRLPLERRLASLPSQVFTADDSLGWVYQFWQSKKKGEVDKSGLKIDGRSLPAVTQLFTEHYMVEFLLHNTIGAWWCGQHGIQGPPDGAGVPATQCPVRLDYLRWTPALAGDDSLSRPAAGTFEGWPKTLKEFTMLDPCCGSGHFLVAGFHLIVPLRMHDERLSARDAVDAVLKENLFGLEIDPRCTQIAAFALALAAWKHPGEDGQPLGYRALPPLNIACSGQGVVGAKSQWTRFADRDSRFEEGMDRLYDLFQKAPTLGSLIDPRSVADDLFALGFETLKGTLDRALRMTESQVDPERAAVGVAACGIALAASLMAREFTLVATNVPYLARGKQAGKATEGEPEGLRDYLETRFALGKADLATAFVERCLEYCAQGGSTALVTPQNWLFLGSYKALRKWLLQAVTWNGVAKLGPAAFEDMNWWAANTMLSIFSVARPDAGHALMGLDASGTKMTAEKPALLRKLSLQFELQAQQLRNPDARVILGLFEAGALLSAVADYGKGSATGDRPRFVRCFWELNQLTRENQKWLDSTETADLWSGREHVTTVPVDSPVIQEQFGSRIHGQVVWTRRGIAVNKMRNLQPYFYTGEVFDDNVGVIAPNDRNHLAAVWCYVESGEYLASIRMIDQKLNVTAATLTKVPFDLERWQQVAAEEYPDGLPEPHSADPTQWLFRGEPVGSTDPHQVASARLLGYRWPDEEPDKLDALADRDGIVPISATRGEAPAADRLREVLRTVFGSEWSVSMQNRLLTDTGAKPGTSLDDWLRNQFFEQHSRRFHNRPFIWHIWDGRKDGFACLANYHKLDHALLETLTYSYVQDWLSAQAAASKSSQTGADLRLNAAQGLQEKLKLILAGEPPYDIFVRWKPLAEQSIGWNPDLNDGIRLNIRPFMTAGILRKNPNIKWTKDRGTEPKRDKDQFPWFWNGDDFTGERVNDRHLTNAEKQAARASRSSA